MLGGAAAGAAAGGLIGWLAGQGVPEEEARYYDEEFRGGKAIVTVRAGNRYAEAMAILRRYGTCEAPGLGQTSTRGTTELRGETKTVPVREEEVVVEKRPVETGEVTVRKEVVQDQQRITVPVEKEEIHIERHPVDRPASTPVGEGETIRVPLREEQVEVTKRPVVREEVEISKQTVREEVPVSETVRREEVRIEREDWEQAMPRFRQEWQSRYGTTGGRWEMFEPGYRYGYEMASDPRYRDRDWATVEPELRGGYEDWTRRTGYRHDDSPWDRTRDSVRESWDSARARVGR